MLYNGWRYPPFKLLEAGVNVIEVKKVKILNTLIFPGSAGGGVGSGEVNETIQQFLGSFARESFGTPRNFCIVLRWFLFHCTEWIVGSVMIFYSHRKVTK